MAKSHKGAKDFLLGAFIGGIVGIAAVSLTRSGSKKNNSNKQLFDSLSQFGKTMASSRGENKLAEIIDWTAEGIQLWNKLKKGS
jgi:gas vesicle protein